ncbi:YqiA/YcfP family alpha/beta fold hydrolase [Halomonas sp. BC04]|uniref:YqiA/YcfP family alpha/beta fold hydrolase n=1 Tax=Halomonas sp. BC04 TaxID=1403540 RepID=UPI0003ED84F5|nr:YqiA/YcfP family alpha/beta fold hydrolase [Halomonas sp. BC04]EWH03032.1 esterase [Halomonas sp. BC04]
MLSAPKRRSSASGVLYLHGFNSGVGSPKAALMRLACKALGLRCKTPQLPHRPAAAYRLAEACLGELGPKPLVAGSSLGGFLATCLAERHDLPAVVINPAIRPGRLVAGWVDEVFVNEHTGERFAIEPGHVEELASLTPLSVSPERYLLLLGTADESLDPADAFDLYRGARTILHPGGDHAFGMLAEYLPAILAHGGYRLEHGRISDQDLDMDDA